MQPVSAVDLNVLNLVATSAGPPGTLSLGSQNTVLCWAGSTADIHFLTFWRAGV